LPNLLYRRLPIGDALERRTAIGLATRDTAQRGGAATQVAAGILPAVELGFQPGGRKAPHAANHWAFSSRGSGRQDAALYGSQDGCRYEIRATGDDFGRY